MDNETVYQLEIRLSDESLRAICIAYLDHYNVTAIEESKQGLLIYDPDIKYLNGACDYILEELGFLIPSQLSISKIQNRNWNKDWESSFEPIVIDDFCAIRASHHGENFNTKYLITINPELAFGTGHHETTYQMIDMMRHIDFKGKKVLDYGCGTGILAILAQQLGGSRIDAIDNDIHAVKCSEDCITLNNSDLVKVSMSHLEDLKGDGYEIILANINRKVLLDSAGLLSSKQPPQGYLLISGILIQDEELILNMYKNSNYKYLKGSTKGNWSCLLFQLA